MRLGSIMKLIRAFDGLPCRVSLSCFIKRRVTMVRKVLLALMKDGRDQTFLMDFFTKTVLTG
jgi:hypothetical protein